MKETRALTGPAKKVVKSKWHDLRKTNRATGRSRTPVVPVRKTSAAKKEEND